MSEGSGVRAVVYTDGGRFLGPVEGQVQDAVNQPGAAHVVLVFTFHNATDKAYDFGNIAYTAFGVIRQRPIERAIVQPDDSLSVTLEVDLRFYDDRPTISRRVAGLLNGR